MTIKHTLMATTAALVLTAGGFAAQAQQVGANDVPPSAAPSAAGATNPSTMSTPAQSSPILHELKNKTARVNVMNVSVKQLDDMAIYSSDAKKIGEIERVLGDSANTPKAVVVNAGGFLGVGTHEVVFPLDKLTKGKEAKHLQTSMTKDDINNLEKWDSVSSYGKPSTTAKPTAAPKTYNTPGTAPGSTPSTTPGATR